MVNSEDAKYILSEIRSMPYYESKIALIMYRLAEIDIAIERLNEPASPNGGTDVMVKGKEVRIKVAGHGTGKEAILAGYITSQKPLEQELIEWKNRYARAGMYKTLLLQSKDGNFARDFLEGKKRYRDLEKEYFVSNAYDKMIRIITQTIERT